MADDDDLSDLLGPEPAIAEAPEKPKSRPMGEASRALLERSRSYDVMKAARKNTPERLNRILNAARDMPVANSVCLRAGISYTTLKYWLQKSLEGAPGDGFDITLAEEADGDVETVRFHEAWDTALTAGVEKVEHTVMQRAMGYREVLTFQGRVIYQQDPALIALGFTGTEAYLLDKDGAPVPETVEKMDPDLAMFILKQRKPTVYGPKSTVDFNVKGGVLVVGTTIKNPEDLQKLEESYFSDGRPKQITFEDDGGDD